MMTSTYFTERLTSKQYRILALHCNSHNYTYSSLNSSRCMAIDALTADQAEQMKELEEAVTLVTTDQSSK